MEGKSNPIKFQKLKISIKTLSYILPVKKRHIDEHKISYWGFLFAENKNSSISNTGIRLQIQEFAYPFIPDASKILVEVPLSLIEKKGVLSRTNTRIWYLTASPFFVPDPFYEIGFTAE